MKSEKGFSLAIASQPLSSVGNETGNRKAGEVCEVVNLPGKKFNLMRVSRQEWNPRRLEAGVFTS